MNPLLSRISAVWQRPRKLLIILITIEGEGDSQAAANLIKTYSNIRPELKKLLDTAESTVPLEFVPVYAK